LNFERNATHRVNIHIAGAIGLMHVGQFDDFAVFHVTLATEIFVAAR